MWAWLPLRVCDAIDLLLTFGLDHKFTLSAETECPSAVCHHWTSMPLLLTIGFICVDLNML